MKALIVYDSFFSNTEKIAKAISSDIPESKVVKVNDFKPDMLTGIDLLIVGSPTRAFNATPAINNFIKSIPTLKGVKVAAFDTRVSVVDVNNKLLNVLVKVFGYAAKKIADKLVKKGGTLLVEPQWFIVKGNEGPLKDGELERAAKLLAK